MELLLVSPTAPDVCDVLSQLELSEVGVQVCALLVDVFKHGRGEQKYFVVQKVYLCQVSLSQ